MRTNVQHAEGAERKHAEKTLAVYVASSFCRCKLWHREIAPVSKTLVHIGTVNFVLMRFSKVFFYLKLEHISGSEQNIFPPTASDGRTTLPIKVAHLSIDFSKGKATFGSKLALTVLLSPG